MAAVTATPTTSNDRPSRVTGSPTRTSSVLAKAASTTTPPSLTQLPCVSLGWSTDAGAASRPTACTSDVRPDACSSALVTGYGPLWPMTPGALASSSRPDSLAGWSMTRSAGSAVSVLGCGETLATTSGPLVASRVLW